LEKRSQHSSHLITFAIVCAGLLLVVIGQFFEGKIDFPKIFVSVGSTIIFIGTLHWLYDTFARKSLQTEITETILGSRSVADSGVAEFFGSSTEINFKDHIANSSSLLSLFSYNTRFILDYQKQIEDLLDRGGSATFVFLGSSSSTLKHMQRLGWAEDSMAANYSKIDWFKRELDKKYPGKFRIQYVDAMLRYSAIVLDNSIFVIWNTCSNGRQAVPAFLVKARTPLHQFVNDDITKLISEGQ
jgi:hypothetical protein